MHPLDALDKAILMAFCSSRCVEKPGTAIKHLPQDIRAGLQELTSDMTQRQIMTKLMWIHINEPPHYRGR